jgi:hypothetical protein
MLVSSGYKVVSSPAPCAFSNAYGSAVRLSAKSLLIAAMCCLGGANAWAGKSANVNACVNLLVKPQSTITFSFSPVATNCMNHSGNSADMEVSKAGVSCTSIGYVEAKGSGGCAFESSRWNLSYSVSDHSWSGSAHTKWATGTGIVLESYPPKTSVNTSPTVSSATKMNWSGDGPIYIIFTPGATGSDATAASVARPTDLAPAPARLSSTRQLKTTSAVHEPTTASHPVAMTHGPAWNPEADPAVPRTALPSN